MLAKGRASIGYWIAPGFRRQGYAAAALGVLVDWASTLTEINRVEQDTLLALDRYIASLEAAHAT